MTRTERLGLGIFILMFAAATLPFFINLAHANPLEFNRKQSAVATTTLISVTPTATSTLAFDTAPGVGRGANDAVLMLQHVGSSTANSNINVSFQYSQGGTNGANCETNQSACDWYDDNTMDYNATSTLTITPNPANRWIFAYASTTIYGGGDNRNMHMINVPQHTRYVRAVITAAGSANSQVWYEFINRKEVQ